MAASVLLAKPTGLVCGTHHRGHFAAPQPLVLGSRSSGPVSTSAPATGATQRAGRVATRASAASGPSSEQPKRHAFLHDFCMSIPFGGISAAAGVVFFLMGVTKVAGVALIAGVTALMASVLSLQEWKAGGNSTQYTLISGGSAASVAYVAVSSLPQLGGAGYALGVALAGLAAALSAFCAYNVLAGGNPPPKPKGDKGKGAPAAGAA